MMRYPLSGYQPEVPTPLSPPWRKIMPAVAVNGEIRAAGARVVADGLRPPGMATAAPSWPDGEWLRPDRCPARC
jgi:hypothetical protein